jgi:hypothetical protein
VSHCCSWISLKYPMKREIRAKLAKLYFELSGASLSLARMS